MRELAASLAALVVTDHRWLGFEDGTCASVPDRCAVGAVGEIIAEVRPDTVLTFGPDGMTGHPDHQTVSRWVTEALSASGRTATLLYATTTEPTVERFADLHERFDVFAPGFPQCAAEEELALRLGLDGDLLDRKLVALRSQATQTAALVAAIGAERFADWCAEECFVRAAGS